MGPMRQMGPMRPMRPMGPTHVPSVPSVPFVPLRDSFDDYLALRDRDFSRDRLVVFTGRSGSGKSTAIRFLLDEHPDFRGRRRIILEGPPFTRVEAGADVIAIDDLTSLRELGTVRRFLAGSRTLLVASHLDPAWFAPLSAWFRCAFFRTDADEGKIARDLERRGVVASAAAVRRYASIFGATYTDLDIILERYPEPTFDIALAKFTKFCTSTLTEPSGRLPPR